MGKKLFRFFQDPAKRVDPVEGEAAASAGQKNLPAETADRMRALLKSEYTPEQLAALEALASGDEGAARFEDQPLSVEEVITPPSDMLKMLAEQTGLRIVQLKNYPKVTNQLRSLVTAE